MRWHRHMGQRRIATCSSVLKPILIRSRCQNNSYMYAGLWPNLWKTAKRQTLSNHTSLQSGIFISQCTCPTPKLGKWQDFVKGSKCEYAKLKPGTHEQLPITPELLLQMRKTWERNPVALTTLCFGQLRAYVSLVY